MKVSTLMCNSLLQPVEHFGYRKMEREILASPRWYLLGKFKWKSTSIRHQGIFREPVSVHNSFLFYFAIVHSIPNSITSQCKKDRKPTSLARKDERLCADTSSMDNCSIATNFGGLYRLVDGALEKKLRKSLDYEKSFLLSSFHGSNITKHRLNHIERAHRKFCSHRWNGKQQYIKKQLYNDVGMHISSRQRCIFCQLCCNINHGRNCTRIHEIFWALHVCLSNVFCS